MGRRRTHSARLYRLGTLGEHIAASLGKGDRMLRVADRARLEGEAKGWR